MPILTNAPAEIVFTGEKLLRARKRLEPSTYGLEIRCSIRLSYGRICYVKVSYWKDFSCDVLLDYRLRGGLTRMDAYKAAAGAAERLARHV